MQATHHYDNEYDRVLDLESYQVMDSGSEVGFDLLTTLACAVCNTPIAFISFIDSTRQWFKSSVGIDIEEIPRSLTACNETIQHDNYFTVSGPALECDTPYAKTMKKLGLNFYAGVPVHSRSGLNIGTLCVMDYQPRQFKESEFDKLILISKQITRLLEARNNYSKNTKMIADLEKEKSLLNKNLGDMLHTVSRKSLAELSVGISHRLQENLIVIENVSENILNDTSISETTKRELVVLNQGVDGIKDLVLQLGTYIGLLNSEENIKFSVKNVVHDVLQHLSYELSELKIECVITHEEDLYSLGNPSYFQEAFYSLLRNSIEAISVLEEKRIEVSLRVNGNKGELDVMDTGLGIADGVRPFLFQPLFTTKNKEHPGIGLSMSQTLLQKSGSSITLVKASNPTIFRMNFNILEDHAALEKSSATSSN